MKEIIWYFSMQIALFNFFIKYCRKIFQIPFTDAEIFLIFWEQSTENKLKYNLLPTSVLIFLRLQRVSLYCLDCSSYC